MALPAAAEEDINIFYLLVSGYLVFFMQCGFAMLSAGSVRAKNAKNIILKNLLDACFGAVGWYLTGYAFAYGDETKEVDGEIVNDGNGFIGNKFFAFNDLPRADFASWFFQYAFAATAATIVSGAVAERTKFEGYLCYALFLTMFVYPCIVHWVWSGSGWASAFRDPNVGDLLFDVGVVDFAGCGVVHMTGGLAGLAGAWVVGPRIGRFDQDGKPRDIPGHNAALAILGVFILWFGWFGFNPGSTLGLIGVGQVAATCAVTTTLSAAAGTIGTLGLSMFVHYIESGHLVWDLIITANGTLAGLVGITAGCSVVKSWAAIIIGLCAGFLYFGASRLVSHVLKVDDPLDAIAVHGFMGAWGLLATALFADEEEMGLAGYPKPEHHGLFMGGGGRLLGANLVLVLVVTGWVLTLMIPFFFILKQVGLLRVDPEEEHMGLDVSHHGGSAYADADEEAKVKKYADTGLKEELEKLKQEVNTMRDAMRSSTTEA